MNLKYIIYLLLVLFFIPTFRCPIPGFQVYMFFLVLIPFLFIYTALKPAYVYNSLILLYKKTPFKYFIFFLLWVILDSIYLMLYGTLSPVNFVYTMFMTFGCLYFGSYFLPLIINRYISLKKYIKYFIIAVYALLIIGLFFFIGYEFDIGFIQTIHSIICNERFLSFDSSSGLTLSYFEKVRTTSTFAEAGWYAEFLFFASPIIYNLITYKHKIFKNNFLDVVIRITIFPLIIISIILTKSPIWLIFYGLLMLFITRKSIFNIIKKFGFIAILAVSFFVMIFTTNSDISSSIIQSAAVKRINNTIESIGDFHSFAISEGSLANRIISYKVSYILFTKHPITGVGFNNVAYHAYNVIQSIDLPLTNELRLCIQNFYYTGKMHTNSSALFSSLAFSGILGFILFYLFLIKTCQHINKVQKQLFGIEKIFFQQLRVSFFAAILVSFYSDFFVTNYMYWFFLGLCNPFLIQKKYIMLPKNQSSPE